MFRPAARRVSSVNAPGAVVAPLIAFTTRMPFAIVGSPGPWRLLIEYRPAGRGAAVDHQPIGRRIIGAEKGIERYIAACAGIVGDVSVVPGPAPRVKIVPALLTLPNV